MNEADMSEIVEVSLGGENPIQNIWVIQPSQQQGIVSWRNWYQEQHDNIGDFDAASTNWGYSYQNHPEKPLNIWTARALPYCMTQANQKPLFIIHGVHQILIWK